MNMDSRSLDQAKRLTIELALKKLLNSKSFSICTIDKIADLMDCRATGPAYDILSTLHCIDYGDMPAELQRQLPDLIISAFNGPIQTINIEDILRKAAPESLVRRLEGRGSSE